MMDETKVLWILDFLSDKAKEFVQVSNEVLDGEKSLQARDDKEPTEWQTCSTLSAFINYVAEAERLRYGHFAYDIARKNNEYKMQPAQNVLARMMMFWEHDDSDELSDDELNARKDHIEKFLENDSEIKAHLAKQPDMYEDGVPQETHREWSIKLRILGEKEAVLLKQWKKLVKSQAKQPQTPQTSSLPEILPQ